MLTTMEEKKAYVQKFNVFDDAFFEMVAKDKYAVEDIVRIILHDPELVIAQMLTQGSIKNLYGKSVRLDALCVTGDGRTINVEIQKSDNDNHVKRARYNASCITANVSEPGENYENINDVYVLYISKFDVFRRRRRLYHVERSFRDRGETFPVDDGEHFIYVNASNNVEAEAEDTDVAELMRFFKDCQGQNEKFRRLASRVYDLKNNEMEVDAMCELVQEMAENIAKEMAENIAKEMAENMAKEMAENMAKEMADEKVKVKICSLVRKGLISAGECAEELCISIEEFEKLYQDFERETSKLA